MSYFVGAMPYWKDMPVHLGELLIDDTRNLGYHPADVMIKRTGYPSICSVLLLEKGDVADPIGFDFKVIGNPATTELMGLLEKTVNAGIRLNTELRLTQFPDEDHYLVLRKN